MRLKLVPRVLPLADGVEGWPWEARKTPAPAIARRPAAPAKTPSTTLGKQPRLRPRRVTASPLPPSANRPSSRSARADFAERSYESSVLFRRAHADPDTVPQRGGGEVP